ncbi:hypothetical protein GCM10009837_04170 [Streptomyces durmitorensis]|uniref:GNAT family N-acetyltransferase n=1 Tax=Streptomyces durmitorensis TaxID=319947 RepID=A0ABY4PNY9_9ACTN|nr:hypothetical protein [Streptomyces durmitorensis]UQT54658.1 hypothetical protein M4V62_05855 [Streptomyces durmitorensis]
MITENEWAGAAARNNAEWCDAVCRTHGLRGEFGAGMWSSARRTPPLYPDAVTLTPDASAADLVARIDTASPGCSVKDSFACLDLDPLGFEVLFEAQWIHREPGPTPVAAHLNWEQIKSSESLPAWETAWNDGEEGTGLFRPGLLSDGTTFLAAYAEGRIVAGAIASPGASVVGVSNLFTSADEESAWAGCLAEVARLWPGLPVVGYESGESLDAAVGQGFTPVGPLRVWLHTG